MTTTPIEDRLLADTSAITASADWDDVSQRADQRTARQHRIARGVLTLFVLLVGAGVIWGQTVGIETVDVPDLAQGDPDPNQAAWSEAAPVRILGAWALTWIGSALVGAVVAFASPSHFRTPFIVPRIGRAVGVLAHIAIWNAVVTAIATATRFFRPSDLGGWIYDQSSFLMLGSFTIVALLLTFSTNGVWDTLRYLFGIAVLVNLATATMLDDLPTTDETMWLVSTLGATAVIAGLAAYVVRASGFRVEGGRSLAGLTPWKLAGAALITLGLGATAIGASQGIVLQTQMRQLTPNVEGLEHSIEEFPHPLLTDEAPYALFDGYTLEGPSTQRLDMERYLAAQGFEPTETADLGRSGALALRRPRGDSFEGLVAVLPRADRVDADPTSQLGAQPWARLELSAENRDAFTWMRLVRNLGLSLALIGAGVLWSETAISRYLRGSPSWQRRPRGQERLGWALVVSAAGLLVITSPSEGYVLFVVVASALWYVGAKLLVPGPTSVNR